MIKVCPSCSSTWAGGLRCEECGADLCDPFGEGARNLPARMWKYIRLQYGARRGMIVRVLGILLAPVVAAVLFRASAGREGAASVVLAAAALPAGFLTWYLLHVGAGRAVRLWVLRRGQLNRRRLARAMARRLAGR